MQYTVITNNDLTAFIAQVNAALKNGWRLQGGVSVDFDGVTYNQAMVR
jgi:hypothetical protein